MDKQIQLDSLKSSVEADDIVPELKAGATQLVFGVGDPDADIVIIGEAPGRKEDEQGEPFVGAAGKFLNAMLAAAGLNRGDVYITNIVKYRPPDNRDPLSSEKRVFWPYLMRQLEIIDPKIVITLGRHSGEYFIPNIRISHDHGRSRWVKYHSRDFLVIPLYHPAAALYNGAMRQVLIDDFIAAATLAQKISNSLS